MRSWQRAIVILFTASTVLALAQEQTEGAGELPSGHGYYRGVAVNYRIWEGLALVEGDILLGPVKELEQGREAVAIAGDRYRWPGNVIPYELDPNLPNPERIRAAIEAWEKATPLRFKPHEDEADYVSILRSTTSSTCNSFVGRIGGRQSINLGDGCTTGNTIHELGHTIGLWHTQSRIDRNQHLRVLYENIDKAQWDQYDQQLLSGVDIGPFDYGSIMLYPMTGFTRNTRNSMMTIPPGIPIGQRTALSMQDILAVRALYGEPGKGVTLSTVPAGLPLVVDGELVETPRTFDWAAGEVHRVAALPRQMESGNSRLEFAKWSDGGALEREVTAAEGMHLIANYAQWVRLRTGVTPAGSGRVEVIPASEDGFYPLGTTVQIRATAEGDQRFYRWTAGSGGNTYLNANRQGNASNPVELTIRTATAFYQASFTRGAISTVNSSTPGAQITVDGATLYTPSAFLWEEGSRHTVSVLERTNSPASASRLVFQGWSNGGERTQEVVAAGGGTLTALVQPQHRVLTRVVSTRAQGTASPNAARNLFLDPVSPDGYYDEGTELTVLAAGPEGVPFANFFGNLGSDWNPQTIRVLEQTLVGAHFVSPGLLGISAVVNDASRQPGPLTSGGVFTIYGAGIGPEAPGDASGYTVRVGGVAATVLAAERNAIRFLAPAIANRPSAVVELLTPDRTLRRTLGVQRAAPGLYTVSKAGTGQLDARNADGSRNRKEAPAARGSMMDLRVTGIGDPAKLEITIGGEVAEIVDLRQDAENGHYQVSVRLPEGCTPGPEVPVVAWAEGARSQYGVWAAVR